jgi:hypothetical protein
MVRVSWISLQNNPQYVAFALTLSLTAVNFIGGGYLMTICLPKYFPIYGAKESITIPSTGHLSCMLLMRDFTS